MTLASTDRRPMLFLGAGASRAFGFPTTKEFLEILKERLTVDESNLLAQLTAVPGITDVEHVLDVLDQLILGENPLVKFMGHHQVKMPPMWSPVDWRNFKDNASILRERIRVELFKEYEFNLEKREEIQRRLEGVLGCMRREDTNVLAPDVLDIFTTNYDSVVEKGLARSQPYELADGFRDVPGEPAEWDPAVYESWRPSPTKIGVNLFKLHGSLSWRKAKKTGKILRVNTEERSVISSRMFGENLLLYPASKLHPIKDPFGTLHTYFARKLLSSHTCFVIGFSFRDPYLNTVFADFLRRDRSNVLCVISPSAEESVQNLFEKATPEEIPPNLIRQVVARNARFEDPDTEGAILGVMRVRAQPQ